LEVTLASSLNHDQLLRLARHGATTRVKELRDEIASIVRAFPDLRQMVGRSRGANRRGRRQIGSKSAGSQQRAVANERGSRRRGWTAAQRKAAADRMRAYWAKRKAGRKK
jgi:hypothetical protein